MLYNFDCTGLRAKFDILNAVATDMENDFSGNESNESGNDNGQY